MAKVLAKLVKAHEAFADGTSTARVRMSPPRFSIGRGEGRRCRRRQDRVHLRAAVGPRAELVAAALPVLRTRRTSLPLHTHDSRERHRRRGWLTVERQLEPGGLVVSVICVVTGWTSRKVVADCPAASVAVRWILNQTFADVSPVSDIRKLPPAPVADARTGCSWVS